jgi:hypothetical protein
MKEINIIDGFFDNFNLIKDAFKNIPLYNLKQYKKKFNEKNNWPGYRSDNLINVNPFLYNLILKEIFNKLKIGFFAPGTNIEMRAVIHLRTSNSVEDWIHTDPVDKTLLVYLSETNLESGTALYEEDNSPSTIVKFIQNRALLFDGKIKHSSLHQYGKNIKNGRLTLNCFFKRK